MTIRESYYRAVAQCTSSRPTLAGSPVVDAVLQRLPRMIFGPPAVGLLQVDRRLGWRNAAHARAEHPTPEFLVRYDTDGHGRRTGPGATSGAARVVLLGCSWAFGHGVAAEQTCGAQAAGLLGAPVANLAVMGYGPVQALFLARDGALQAASVPGAHVIYLWIPEQLVRAWRRKAWISRMAATMREPDLGHPVLDVASGRLVDAGVLHVGEGVDDGFDPLALLDKMEMAVTALALRDVAALCRRDGSRFTVVVPPLRHVDGRDRAHADELVRLLGLHGTAVRDLDERAVPPAERADLFFRFDGHPRPEWHRLTALRLAELVSA